ncbi:hypothetical protein [Glycomyces tarimensis]
MDQVINLDEAAEAIGDRCQAWQHARLAVSSLTWRDAASPWPQRIVTDRSTASDPDSVGVQIQGPGDAGLHIVLYRGGWADIDYITVDDDLGTLHGPDIGTAQDFGLLLDDCVTRTFGIKINPL